MTRRVIEIEADVTAAISGLNRLNSALKSLQGEQDKASKGQKGLGNKVSKTKSNFGSMFRVAKQGFGMLTSLVADAGKSIALLGVSVIGAGIAIKSSLADFELGLTQLVRLEANKNFLDIADAIQLAGGHMVSLNDAISIAQRAVGLGIADPKTIKQLSKLATVISQIDNKAGDTAMVMTRLIKLIQTGNMEEEFRVVVPTIGLAIEKQKEMINNLTGQQRAQATLNIVMREGLNIIKQQGQFMSTPWFKLLSVIKQIKDQFSGLGEVMTGFGKATLGILAPLGAGLASMFINPVTGIFGLAIGGTLTAGIGALVSKILRIFGERVDADTTGGKQKDVAIKDRIAAFFTILTSVFEIFFAGLMGLKGEVETDAKALELTGIKLTAFDRIRDGILNITQGIAKAADALLLELGFGDINVGNMIDKFGAFGKRFNELSEGFGTAFGQGMKNIFTALKFAIDGLGVAFVQLLDSPLFKVLVGDVGKAFYKISVESGARTHPSILERGIESAEERLGILRGRERGFGRGFARAFPEEAEEKRRLERSIPELERAVGIQKLLERGEISAEKAERILEKISDALDKANRINENIEKHVKPIPVLNLPPQPIGVRPIPQE